MAILLVLVVMCGGLAAPASPGESPETHARQIENESSTPSADLVEKKRELRTQWTEYVEFLAETHHSDIWIYRNKTAPLDALLKDVFRQAIKESGSFDGAMKQLQDLVRWQQVPDELVMGGLQKEVRDSVVTVLPEPILPGLERDVLEDGPDDFVPIIVYLLPEGNVNPAVGFFVNAYPTKDSGKFCRVRTPPYALMLSDKEVHCADLTKQFTYAGSEPSAGGHNILMVDTFDTGDAYPSVALVDGPGGGGGILWLTWFSSTPTRVNGVDSEGLSFRTSADGHTIKAPRFSRFSGIFPKRPGLTASICGNSSKKALSTEPNVNPRETGRISESRRGCRYGMSACTLAASKSVPCSWPDEGPSQTRPSHGIVLTMCV